MTSRVPTSTYRLQITADFDLFAAAEVLPYLHDLGVDWVYLSPLLAAEPGSTHGYDVVAHDRVDASRGGAEGLAALSAAARSLGMGVLVDIVPNHMGVASSANSWWADVLAHGQDSAYADYFDVDWAAGDGAIRTGADLNYRRFFTIETLAGLRVEERAVFDHSHVEIRRWFDDGLVDGLRVDHPDGLLDPRGYLDDLAGLTGSAYVLVEKILEPGESLLSSWATAGTTGYDALGLVDRVLTDPRAAALPGSEVDFHAMVHDTKRVVADGALSPEVRRIVRDLALIETTPLVERVETEDAVAELLACFPVYRSYLPEGREHLDAAFAAARGHRPDLGSTFDALLPVLSDPAHPAALRFQQTSGMVMAKGVEDCAFYRYSQLTSLNEVGGDPSVSSLSVDDFHEAMAVRQRDWPHAMTCTTTHDTKRSEDLRARIAVLAEIPHVWADALKRLLEIAPIPDSTFGSLLWQAILGAWSDDPALRDRLHAYAEKAMREAGDHTTWIQPDDAYESAVHGAVDAAFDDPGVRTVLDDLLARVVEPGWTNALSAKLLALAAPGVPDVYQGTELWDLSLVDPDNRRPVDFDHRRSLLGGVATDPAEAKLEVVREVLTLRRDRPELFTSYAPIRASGAAAEHVVAFDRGGVVAVATRMPVGLAARGGWGDTTLELPDGPRPVAEVLAGRPVALLVRDDR